MKIILNTKNQKIIDGFNRVKSLNKFQNMDFYVIRGEFDLVNSNSKDSVDTYLIDYASEYSSKFISSLKRKNPYAPVIIFGPILKISDLPGGDLYIPYSQESESKEVDAFCKIAIISSDNYAKKISSLKKLSENPLTPISFGNCRYDPRRRSLYVGDKEVKKLSAKEGGILEILSSNLGEVVKKEAILEKVWNKIDYFSGRSMDVYVTHLRNTLRNNGIAFSIKNISGIGLLME